MCTMVHIKGDTCMTQGELRQHLPLVYKEIYNGNGESENACLCPVDVGAALERAGLAYEYDPGFDEYFVEADE